jgi:hypothetical protein
VGPGYDYLHQDQPRDTSHPFTGQHTGIRWWRKELNEPEMGLTSLSETTMRYFVKGWDNYNENMNTYRNIMNKDVDNRAI